MADASAGLPVRGRGFGRDLAPYVLIVGAIWLAWQVLLEPVKERGPAQATMRVAPGSPLVLRRASEEELAAGRVANAASLARDALVRSPFDVRALRIVGLSAARSGHEDQADDLLTLAGNWSLRDDPTHAWLIEHRLKRGDYASALAHADTLVRRREDIRPRIFALFTTAAAEDAARALPVVTHLVAARPPWRQSYLDSLYVTPEGRQVAANLAITLQATPAPLTSEELSQLYFHLLEKGQIEAVRTIRARLNRPPVARAVSNGGFDDPTASPPFQWTLGQGVGVVTDIIPDDIRTSDPALRVEYDGYSTTGVAEQLLLLAPGRYRLGGESRVESGAVADHLNWTLTCTGGDQVILTAPAAGKAAGWAPFAHDFTVPANCTGQWLRLSPRGGDRRAPVVGWFDRLSITRLP